MNFFGDDDFFSEILRKFGGEGFVEYSSVGPDGKRKTYRGNRKSSNKFFLDKVVFNGRIYFMFDLSGRDNISTKIETEVYEDDRGKKRESGNQILLIYENDELLTEFPLGDVNRKGFETHFNNGILEVNFRK